MGGGSGGKGSAKLTTGAENRRKDRAGCVEGLYSGANMDASYAMNASMDNDGGRRAKGGGEDVAASLARLYGVVVVVDHSVRARVRADGRTPGQGVDGERRSGRSGPYCRATQAAMCR
jgi:hypothetical protein